MRHGKAFPHRIVAMINDAGYEKLKEESLARGYQIALIERWMLIPQSVEDLYTGNLDDADVMMRRPLPSGNTKDRGPKRTRRNIWLTDAGWEAVTRCAAKRGLVRSAYVARSSTNRSGSRTNPDGRSRTASPTNPSRRRYATCSGRWKSPLLREAWNDQPSVRSCDQPCACSCDMSHEPARDRHKANHMIGHMTHHVTGNATEQVTGH